MLNIDEILEKLKADYKYFSNVRKELREDKDFCLLAIDKNPFCYLVNSFKFKTDIDVIRYILNTGNIDIIMMLNFDEKMLETNQEYKNLYFQYIEFKKKLGYATLYGTIFKVHPDEVYKYVTVDFMSKFSVILETLNEREVQVLMMRFGLSNGNFKTYGEVGNNFNVTKERVRQIEAKAIRKLCHPTRKDLILFNAAMSGIPSAVEWLKLKTESTAKTDTNISIDSLGFSVRNYYCLMRSGLTTLDSLLNLSQEDLLKIEDLDRNGIDQIISLQKKYSNENSEEKGKNK